LDASGIGSSESFGSAQLDLTIFPDGLVSGEAFGTTTVEAGDQFISPTGMSTSEAFGTSAITLYLDPTGIGSSESFGAAQLDLTIFPDGLVSGEAFGTVVVATDEEAAAYGEEEYAAAAYGE
jgi:Na+-transporting NADH:ubiquinone oxidoreductase subunit NqrD